MHLLGVCFFRPGALHGTTAWRYALAWSIPLFLAALLEDFFYRGYLPFTLTRGIGFWPAATISSLLMGGAHYFNPGGHGLGPIAAILYCFVTVFLCEGRALFGCRSASTQPGAGEKSSSTVYLRVVSWLKAIFQTSFHGMDLLTGGFFGPEASILNIVLLAMWLLIFALMLHELKYPNAKATSASACCSVATEIRRSALKLQIRVHECYGDGSVPRCRNQANREFTILSAMAIFN